LELVQELADVAYFNLDLTTLHTVWSNKVFEIYGLDPADGVPPLEKQIDFYHEDDRDEVSRLVQIAREKGEGFAFRLRLRRADGQIVPVEAKAAPLMNEKGEAISLVGVFRRLDEAPQA
jgi:two-component system CheB/CheR fusion protein